MSIQSILGMRSKQVVIQEITNLTTKIETKYPELYRFLDENPLTIPSKNDWDIDLKNLEDYLESLKQLVQQYLKIHKPK